MALAVTTSPAHVDGATVSSTVTTATFSPPANSFLVACIGANTSSGGTTTLSVTSSNSLTWTAQAVAGRPNQAQNGLAAIYTAPCTAGATNMTVTVTTGGSTSTTRRPSVDVYVVTGVNFSSPVANTAISTSASNAASFSPASTVANSMMFVSGTDWQKFGVGTTSGFDAARNYDMPGSDGVSGSTGYKLMGSSGSTFSYTLDAAGSSASVWNVARIELRPLVTVSGTATASLGGLSATATGFTVHPLQGVPFIPEIAGSKIAVEIAWGADLTDLDGSSYVWHDITEDVRIDGGMSITLGRSDEASTSQPATLDLKLDNSSGDYSLGGKSSNWPHVRRNTPVRVRIDLDDGQDPRTVFQGYANGFTPGWDSSAGKVPTVSLSASGVLRRLSQGKDPLRSALYRHLTLVQHPDEYWPMEEAKGATQALSVTGSSPAQFVPILSAGVLYGKVAWGADEDNPATSRAVQVSSGGAIVCPIRSPLFPSYIAISFSMRYTAVSGARVRLETVLQDDTAQYIATFFTDGNVEITEGHNSSPVMSWNQGDFTDWDDVWHHYTIVVNGFAWSFYRDGVVMDTSTAVTKAAPEKISFYSIPDPGGAEDPVSVAHVAMFASAPNIPLLYTAASAHVGELPIDRLERLCDQESVALEVIGSTVITMGPQLPISFLDLLRECEAADQGILYDGVGPGLRYITRDERENAAVDLTVQADELVSPFEPVHDDQRVVNRATASNISGAKASYEDTNGAMGTEVIGIYDSSIEVNLSDEDDVQSYASWLVHLGTVEGYRFPSITTNLRAVPSLAASMLDVAPSSRVTVEDVDVIESMPDEDIQVLVEGVSMQLSPYGWVTTLKCSPFGPWAIGLVANTTGDTSADLIRLDSNTSTVSSNANANATSISVATSSGPLWTTKSDDFPLYLDVGGVRVRATACSGSSSPQTFTVDALPISRASGLAVKVWNPPVLGL